MALKPSPAKVEKGRAKLTAFSFRPLYKISSAIKRGLALPTYLSPIRRPFSTIQVALALTLAEALTQAQQYVRENSPQYKDPYFWAGFTLRGTYQ